MQSIEIGDLQLAKDLGAKQVQLFQAIRAKIVDQLWPKGGKLPSTRVLAKELSLSRNTVMYAYDQLVAEGILKAGKARVSMFALNFRRPIYPLSRPNMANHPLLRQRTWMVHSHLVYQI